MSSTRRRWAIVPLCLLLLTFLFIRNCVPTPIDDLRFVEIERVPAAALPVRAEPLEDRTRALMINRGEALLKISLSGSSDWIGEVWKHNLNSYPVVALCDDRDREIFALGVYVGQAHVTYGEEIASISHADGATLQYDLYVPERGKYRSRKDFNAQMPPYDLRTNPGALCVSIAGGSMAGAYGRSNEVRVNLREGEGRP